MGIYEGLLKLYHLDCEITRTTRSRLTINIKSKIKNILNEMVTFVTTSLITNLVSLLFNLADVLSIILPVLLSVAFMTIIERKQLAAHQRRVGPVK
jgi:hypothetical protein